MTERERERERERPPIAHPREPWIKKSLRKAASARSSKRVFSFSYFQVWKERGHGSSVSSVEVFGIARVARASRQEDPSLEIEPSSPSGPSVYLSPVVWCESECAEGSSRRPAESILVHARDDDAPAAIAKSRRKRVFYRRRREKILCAPPQWGCRKEDAVWKMWYNV